MVDGIENIEGRSKDPLEQQAFAFAGEFLAPEQALRGWLEARGDPLIDITVLARLGVAFGISAPAMYVRLDRRRDPANAPSSGKSSSARSINGQHRGVEKALDLDPVEDQLARLQREQAMPRLPAKLRDNALAAYAAGLIDLDRLALALRRDRATVERLVTQLGLDAAGAGARLVIAVAARAERVLLDTSAFINFAEGGALIQLSAYLGRRRRSNA